MILVLSVISRNSYRILSELCLRIVPVLVHNVLRLLSLPTMKRKSLFAMIVKKLVVMALGIVELSV